jgi:predicted type IV restriction endonuclease
LGSSVVVGASGFVVDVVVDRGVDVVVVRRGRVVVVVVKSGSPGTTTPDQKLVNPLPPAHDSEMWTWSVCGLAPS